MTDSSLVAATCVALLASLGLAGCGEDTALELSCAGEFVEDCRPYEHAVVLNATFEPEGLPINDPSAEATVEVQLASCGADSPFPTQVQIQVVEGDGNFVREIATVFDTGTGEDETIRDDIIRAVIPNPFIGQFRARTDITLRFVPKSGDAGCAGEVFELPYRTGNQTEAPRL